MPQINTSGWNVYSWKNRFPYPFWDHSDFLLIVPVNRPESEKSNKRLGLRNKEFQKDWKFQPATDHYPKCNLRMQWWIYYPTDNLPDMHLIRNAVFYCHCHRHPILFIATHRRSIAVEGTFINIDSADLLLQHLYCSLATDLLVSLTETTADR